jgi:transposase InsO family protein
MENLVLSARETHPTWGGRKLRRVLLDEGVNPPSASTITQILRRHGKLSVSESAGPGGWQRFERELPNELWQMDFKGHFPMLDGRCHPLDVLDDHSRYCLCLKACPNQQGATVKEHLDELFRLYGLPVSLLCDNGGPWGGGGIYPELAVYLMRLGIRLLHGRPSHPQTQGKLERFHKTLDCDVIQGRLWRHLDDCQKAFDGFRSIYNLKRPHDALGLDTPASRYRPSPLTFPERLPPVEYSTHHRVRHVQQGGVIHLDGKEYRVGKGLKGQRVGISPTEEDGIFKVIFVNTVVRTLDLRHNLSTPGDKSVNHVSEHV